MTTSDTIDFRSMIYNKAVLPSVSDADKRVSSEFKEYCGLVNVAEKSTYPSKLELFYIEKREWLKDIYWGDAKDGEDKLDLHKLSGVLCRSIIGNKPFAFNFDKAQEYITENKKQDDINWLVDNLYINYKVAFDAAMALTLFDLVKRLGDAKEESYPYASDLIKKIGRNAKLDYYDEPFQQTHETFYNSLVMDLALNDLNGRDFDYLSFASICFQLQQYNVVKFELSSILSHIDQVK
jgi:hypothetical protein